MTRAAEIRERGEALRRMADELSGVPCVYGPEGDDCSILPMQWVRGWREKTTGREWPVSVPDYSSREEAEALIERAGGLVNVWNPIAPQLALQPLGPQDVPVIGDVGIFVTSRGEVGGIFLHGGIILWRAEMGTRQIGVWGRSLPVRRETGWDTIPVVSKAWRL